MIATTMTIPIGFDASKDLVASHLRGLDASGAEGFEGLMGDVLAEVCVSACNFDPLSGVIGVQN
jgi:hypothetical protein